MAKSNLSVTDRFMSFVSPEPNSGCWLWIAHTKPRGYGTFKIGMRTFTAHRVSYELFRGNIPEGMQLDHLCRVRCCVNPAHLEPVTNKENCDRGLHGVLWSPKTHCPYGHALTGYNLIRYGRRLSCRSCDRVRARLYAARKRQELRN